MSEDVLLRLAATIADRRSGSANTSYTRKLLDGGPPLCARKVGEEAIETVIAALSGDDEGLAAEAADLLYHLLVLLESRDVEVSEVLAILDRRMRTSGIVEKAGRSAS